MSKKGREVRIRNVPLKFLIDHLIEIYQLGGEYIDLVGMLNDRQDTLGIVVYGEKITDTSKEVTSASLSEDVLKQLYNGIN